MKYHKLLAIGAVISTIISLVPFSPAMGQSFGPAPVDIQTGLVAHWQFDENTGNVTRDSVGNSSGALTNGPLWTQGKVSSGLRFDGIDDVVRIASSAQVNNLQAFTFTAWIYPMKNGGIIFRKGADAAAYINIFTMQDTGQGDTGQLGMRIPYTNQTGIWKTKIAVPLNSWHHIAVKYERGNINAAPSFYVDAIVQEMYQTAAPSGVSIADDNIAFIGNNHISTSGFGGIIDEVRLYNRILSPDQITTIWNLGLGGGVNQSRPNIVVIMTDDQDDMGSMAVMPKTRNLIGSQGLTFTNSFVDFSLCCPSRASFLTGQAAHNTGVLANGLPDGGYQKLQPTQDNSLPVWLQQAGYTTAHMGKYLNGFSSGSPIPPGWTLWNGIADDQGGYTYYNYTINENGVPHAYGNSPADYKTDVQAQKAADFIAGQAGSAQPFFLWLAPFAQHSSVAEGAAGTLSSLPWSSAPAPRHKGLLAGLPLPQPPNFNEADMSDKPRFMQLHPLFDNSAIAVTKAAFQGQRESLLAVDDMVERVVNALQNAGKLDNTIIVFTSDNGYSHGEHRRWEGKQLVYEESIRVPLLIRGPGISKGETRNQLVNNLDLVATIEALSGATPGRVPDGRSLASLFQNPQAPWRSSLLVQGMDKVNNGVSDPTHLYGRFQAVRTSNYLYAEHNGTDFGLEKEFYDLSTDPYELTSRHNDPAYASIVNDLRGRLNILRTCAGATCWIASTESAPAPSNPGTPGGTGGFNPNPLSPPSPPGEPYTPFPPRQMPDGTWVQPTAGGAGYLFVTPLKIGTKNQDVTRLQTFLALDPSVYPEGLVTGYFGNLTKQATIRFQEKYASEILQPLGSSHGTGFVGSATLKKLNELVK